MLEWQTKFTGSFLELYPKYLAVFSTTVGVQGNIKSHYTVHIIKFKFFLYNFSVLLDPSAEIYSLFFFYF